jgi:hypothetical protein
MPDNGNIQQAPKHLMPPLRKEVENFPPAVLGRYFGYLELFVSSNSQPERFPDTDIAIPHWYCNDSQPWNPMV